MTKMLTVVGARPQFIKASPVSKALKLHGVEELILHTGQHYDDAMSKVFFDEMEIPKPKYNLDINGMGHGAMTGQMLEKIEKILLEEKPNAVLVYGDTNSTLAGALAAKKLGVKLIHVEAGLRSYNMSMPEEINRILTDRIADLLLCPTDSAMTNLKQEGFDNSNIKLVKTGDIMKDAVAYYGNVSSEKAEIYSNLNLTSNEFVLATIHRQENTDNRQTFEAIFEGLGQINKSCKVVIPVHPRTKKLLEEYELDYDILFIEPVGYFDMLELLKNCKMVVTDSGGLQKEAFFNRKPVIIARTETEWIELVNYGFGKIVEADPIQMLEAFIYYNSNQLDYSINLYGTEVGEKIYTEVVNLLIY